MEVGVGLFDDLAGKALGAIQGTGAESGVLGSVIGTLLDKNTGGLSALVQNFTQKGLGDIVSSWVSTGANLPVNPDQIRQALGSDQVKSLAAKAGLSPEILTSKLSELLPQVVDKLTPDGKIPADNLIEQGLDFLKGKL